MRTLLDRLEWVLESRELTQRQLAMLSGFDHDTQVSSILHRLRNEPDYPDRMYVGTYRKLAEGGGVDFLWLLTGDGVP